MLFRAATTAYKQAIISTYSIIHSTIKLEIEECSVLILRSDVCRWVESGDERRDCEASREERERAVATRGSNDSRGGEWGYLGGNNEEV